MGRGRSSQQLRHRYAEGLGAALEESERRVRLFSRLKLGKVRLGQLGLAGKLDLGKALLLS